MRYVWPSEYEWCVDNRWRNARDTFEHLLTRNFTAPEAREFMDWMREEDIQNVREPQAIEAGC